MVPEQPMVPGAKGAERGKTGSSSLLWSAFLSFLPPNWSPTNPSVTVAVVGRVMMGGYGQDWGHRRRTEPCLGWPQTVQGGGQTSPHCTTACWGQPAPGWAAQPGMLLGYNPCAVTPGSRIQGETAALARVWEPRKPFSPTAMTSRSQKHHQLPCPSCPILGAVSKPPALKLAAGATHQSWCWHFGPQRFKDLWLTLAGSPPSHALQSPSAGTPVPYKWGARRAPAPQRVWSAGRSQERAPETILGGSSGLVCLLNPAPSPRRCSQGGGGSRISNSRSLCTK